MKPTMFCFPAKGRGKHHRPRRDGEGEGPEGEDAVRAAAGVEGAVGSAEEEEGTDRYRG